MGIPSKIRLVILLSLTAMACSSPLKVITDYDSKADFSQYKSFSFFELKDTGPGLSELNQQRIINATREELIKKGFIEDQNNPQLLVNVTAIVNEKKQITANSYYNYGGYYRPYRWGPSYGGSTVYNVTDLKEGSLIIDILDASSKHLLWQGTGNKEIDTGLKKPETEIPTYINKILSDFPPVPKSSKTK
ncbi:DUF4136 domain-containing protein [Cognataquiflexum rubidum]|uniref:DUF4136 domain-containing protein n=1 Tax=Cognataquiflexum rubidum TaxID=2922273 RepID=UPI001F13F3D3|nr:DUF4136 domain-containing protein [Cognataquiflexum rubidum]MCH6233453.1 DUF4136 domain-containing protein [Cognataquiflexum rubidum]